MPKQSRQQVTELYSFLRMVDDLVDDTTDAVETASRLNSLISQLPPPDARGQVTVPGVSFALDQSALRDFFAGQRSDLDWQPVETEKELVSYCYQVAGTVGILLCPVLGAQGEAARLAALRLGIAMQMTNIARDVLEDARRGRIYLPANWFPTPITASEIGHAKHDVALKLALLRLLRLAERYYKSAASGFGQLPVRQRFVVILATRLYRQIGSKIMAAPELALGGRVRLTRGDRVRQFTRATLQWLSALRPSLPSEVDEQESASLARYEA